MWTKYTQSLATSTVTALQHRAAVHDWLIHWWVHNRSCWSQVKLKWLQQTPPEHSRVISHQLWIIRPPSDQSLSCNTYDDKSTLFANISAHQPRDPVSPRCLYTGSTMVWLPAAGEQTRAGHRALGRTMRARRVIIASHREVRLEVCGYLVELQTNLR